MGKGRNACIWGGGWSRQHFPCVRAFEPSVRRFCCSSSTLCAYPLASDPLFFFFFNSLWQWCFSSSASKCDRKAYRFRAPLPALPALRRPRLPGPFVAGLAWFTRPHRGDVENGEALPNRISFSLPSLLLHFPSFPFEAPTQPASVRRALTLWRSNGLAVRPL